MPSAPLAEDAEPCEPSPAGPLFVPVRPGPAGCAARVFRTPLGFRTAVAFTSPQLLTSLLGAHHPYIRLAEPALRALTAPLGVTRLTVDPLFSAPRAGRHEHAFRTTRTTIPQPAMRGHAVR
ncbi:SAV_915 family protein [Streptomyces sp. NPDC050418]|uniref:SAV_915 family protein n=1 Tax=Streptomyces sp. NPDC050418 TaxID=3365612 RepID=UPI0037AB26EC